MIRRVFVPTIGDKLVLAAPWQCAVKNEYRNGTLLEAIHGPEWYRTIPSGSAIVVFPALTVLTVTRVYIRASGSAARQNDSLSFRTRYNGKAVRFFAHLSDVNHMIVE